MVKRPPRFSKGQHVGAAMEGDQRSPCRVSKELHNEAKVQ